MRYDYVITIRTYRTREGYRVSMVATCYGHNTPGTPHVPLRSGETHGLPSQPTASGILAAMLIPATDLEW